MAKKTDTIAYNTDLKFTAEQSGVLIEMASGDQNPTQKMSQVANHILATVADGGLLLTSKEVQRIVDATGVDPETGEDIVKVLSEATQMEEGCHKVSVRIDPSYYPAYEEIATMQERPVVALFQEVMDMGLEQEWAYQLTPGQRPATILMRPEDKAELEEMLDGKFQTGTELAALVRKALGTDGLFDDVIASNVGQEA
jgi:hypothetical protein